MTEANGNTVFCNKISALTLRDSYIVEQSINLFQEKEPCIIYRSFIHKKALIEIDDYFCGQAKKGQTELRWEQIPENIRRMLQVPQPVETVRIQI